MRDALPAAERLLLTVVRNPAFIAVLVVAPIMLVLVFGFIFGGAITLPGTDGDGRAYREFLVPGLLVTMAFNIVPSMTSVATDSAKGVTDRFRSLPISRHAVPSGQALAHTVYTATSFVIMLACGLAVGWRARQGLAHALAALGLLLLFQFAMSWVGMYLGYLIGNAETAGQASILVLPVSMVSNVFVPTDGMPGWLATIADWNPMSAVSTAVRELFGNPTTPSTGAWSLENPTTTSLAWIVVLLVVFVPLCTRQYARAGR